MWQHVWGDQIDPTQHNSKVRELALEEIKKFRLTFEPDENDAPFLDNTEQQLRNVSGNQTEQFWKFTNDIENKWHPDQKGKFVKLWPELVKAL